MTTLTRYRTLLREHIFRVLFPPAAAWLLLLLFAETIDDLQRLNRFPEGGALHAFFEAGAIWLPVMVVLALAVLLLRGLPGFLRLPPYTPLARAAGRLILRGIALFAAFVIGTVSVNYLLYDPATDPQGQFHIWVWGGGFLYAAALTPLATIFWAWAALRKHEGVT